MTKRIVASELGLEPHFKVRVVLPGALLHLASKAEPRKTTDGWQADRIEDHRYGDTLGFIGTAATIRYSNRGSRVLDGKPEPNDG
jgi:hypothetical protein